MDGEGLQASFLRMDVRTLIKCHVVLGKSALECYMSMKESLGTHTPSYEAVRQWVNAIKNGWVQTDDDSRSGAPKSAMDECHVEKVEPVLERMHSTSCTAIVTEVRTSLASVNRILTNSSSKQKVCAQWIPHLLNNDQ
jgi:transposase